MDRRVFLSSPVADDGTEPEDLELYLADLGRYRQWRLSETPSAYLGRLELLLDSLAEDLAELERLAGLPEGAFAAEPQNLWLAYGRFFHALVAFIDGTKWLIAHEIPEGVAPRSFTEAVAVLSDRGLLPAGGSDACRELCRLRNRFAHGWDWTPSFPEMRALIVRHVPVLRDVACHLRVRYFG